MSAKVTLIIGGARSGKSALAQQMAGEAGGKVLFVATAEAGDDEMARRIEAHQRSRPAHWRTLEVKTSIGTRINEEADQADTVVIDCITLLVSNIFAASSRDADEEEMEKAIETEINDLIDCIGRAMVHFVIVTNEVGLGIVPGDQTSRLYRDMLGRANQMLAARADEVLLMVAGIPVPVKRSE